MLSILIPIYNISCTDLVEDLVAQCDQFGIIYEIICMDDESLQSFKNSNQKISDISYVKYIELDKNIGRARIRNRLAEKSQYQHLLFIDADSRIIRNDFVSKYISNLKYTDVIYGGTNYSKSRPVDKLYLLHWKYASRYEALDCSKRNEKPYLAFMSNNFLIKKDIFNNIKFDESHTGYGYEDTLFAEKLHNHSITIKHIDNPVEHTGLSKTESFILKTDEAMKNLAMMYHNNSFPETRMISFYKKMRSIGFQGLLLFLFYIVKHSILKNLRSENPNLLFFQFYKYGMFCQMLKNVKRN